MEILLFAGVAALCGTWARVECEIYELKRKK